MEVLAALIGAGIVPASPFVPVLRPVAKAAVKGGLAVSEAVAGVAVVVGQQVNGAVTNENDAAKEPLEEAGTVDATSQGQDTEATQLGEDAEIKETQASGLAAGMGSLVAAALRPTAESAVKVGAAVSDKTKGAVAAAGKQWSDLVAEAREPQDVVAEPPAPEVEPVPDPEVVSETKAVPAVEPSPVQAAPAPDPDDLTKIRGIGPKSAALLESAGITTYAQLASVGETRLRQIMEDAGARYRLLNSEGWPEQARQLAEAE